MKKSLILVILFAIVAMTLSAAQQIPIKGYVNADIGLNYRTGPKESASKLGALTNGTQMTFDGAKGRWYHMTSPAVGYVCGDFVVVTKYGDAPENMDSLFEEGSYVYGTEPSEGNENSQAATEAALEAEEATMTDEEKDKLGCNIDRSLIKSHITKAPPQQGK